MSQRSWVNNPDRWATARRLFTEWLTEHDYSPSTTDRLARQLARFAKAHQHTHPWDVTNTQVEVWLAGLTCGPSGMYQYRTMLRTFYGWAHRTGRVMVNPTVYVSGYRRKYAPSTWAASVNEWARWMQAGSLSRHTIRHRVKVVTQLANELPVGSPWDVTTPDLAEWMAGHVWARESARAARSAVRAFYGWAVKAGYLVDSPAVDLPRVKATTPCPRAVPETVYREALAGATGDDVLMLRLAGDLGLRLSEIAGLHSRDLVNEGVGWSLYVRGKGDKTRRLPIPDTLARELREREPGWVFPSPVKQGRPVSPDYVSRRVTRHLPAGYTTHKLRHRFATQVYAVSQDLLATQQLLGHQSPTTTQRYVQLPDTTSRALVEAVAR
ncbi:MAG: tyrosine-type recombinase/integrase [Brooklawnia sp.]|jgi:site-specific recombinase XerC